MTDDLERDEPVVAGVRRMAVAQIGVALAWLDRPPEQIDDAVHAVRQSAKRIRALVELVRADIGGDASERERACFRNVGRKLGEARDAAVLVATLDALAKRFSGQLSVSACERVRRSFAASRDETIKHFVDEGEAFSKVAAMLDAARDRISQWKARGDGFGSLRRGLRRTYGAGRDGLHTVEKDPRPEKFHAWRRPVKMLYYQLQVVAPVWPGPMGELARQFRVLSDWLNENHDLAVLRERLLASNPATTPRDREAFVALVDERCAELQAEALRLGALLYAETPNAFVTRFGHYWKTWKGAQGATKRACA